MKETEVTNNNTQIYPEESHKNSDILEKNSGEAAFIKLPNTKVIPQESVGKYSDSESAWTGKLLGRRNNTTLGRRKILQYEPCSSATCH